MDMFGAVVEFILSHPGVIWTVIAIFVGQFVKTLVFTKHRATQATKARWFWSWGRKTLALHPFVLGLVLGMVWPGPIEGGYTGGTLPGALYFGMFGGLAVWSYETVKGLVAKRYGIVLANPHDPDAP